MKKNFADDEEFEDFDDLEELEEEDAKKKDLSLDDYERQFIFEIEDACPICGGTVRGNDHYKYFCKRCNILFDKKDLIQKGEKKNRHKYRIVPLTKEKRKSLIERRKAFNERLRKAFPRDDEISETVLSDDKIGSETNDESEVEILPPYPKIKEDREEDLEFSEENKEEDSEWETEESEREEIKEGEKKERETKKERSEKEESEEPTEENDRDFSEETRDHDEEDLIAALKGSGFSSEERKENAEVVEEHQEEDLEEPKETEAFVEEPEPEYELEDESRIIASKGSDKIHKGTCHFVRRIHPENRIYFDSIEEGLEAGYELCVCLRRLIARRKAQEAGLE